MVINRGVFVLLLTCTLLQPVSWPAVALADEAGDEASTDASLGVRAGAYALTPFYFVAKVVYAGAGAVTGGLAWAVTGGNTKTAYAVWDPSLKGDYWVSPSHLKGERPLHFVGTTEARSPKEDDAAPELTSPATRDSLSTQEQPKTQPDRLPQP